VQFNAPTISIICNNVEMEVVLCLSGGGYRASIFHLGVLTFLNELKLNDGTVMLNHVHSLSCISGGALTGIKYALSETNHLSRKDTFRQIYSEIVKTNIGDILLKKFEKDSKKGKALVQSLSDIYDENFFKGEKFGKILDNVAWDGLHHFYVDATDFDAGLPFRFQATVELHSTKRKEPYGMIGNWRHRIDRESARNIRLADVMAATSCFPIVFEPLIYPTEFSFLDEEKPSEEDLLRIPLMDGGLIDNQGVEPAYHINSHLTEEGKTLDLAIISDAGISSSERGQTKWTPWDISPNKLFVIILTILVLSFLGLLYSILNHIMFLCGAFIVIFVVCFASCYALRKINGFVQGVLESAIELPVKKSPIWNNTFKSISVFLLSRIKSAYRMTDVIMSGNQRKLWFRALHNDPEWKNRIIMNSINVFSAGKIWKDMLKKKPYLPQELRPTNKMIAAAKVAASMKTSLWFSSDDIQRGVPKAIFAYGRFSTCWNLLVYINELKQLEISELNDFQKSFIGEEQNVMRLWDKMKNNHYYNVKDYVS